MHFDPMIPIWLQIMTEIETDIACGKRLPGEKLPGGRDLALQYAVNPNTAARVYQELEKEGLCETRRGMGTFVTADAGKISALRDDMAHKALADYLETMKTLGFSAKDAARLIEKEEQA